MTILLLMLMAASISLFIMKAKHPSAYWTGLVLFGWFLSMSGLVLFIAKYGGFYFRINTVLFFSDSIRNLLLYAPISIDTISRLITVGRSLFIYSLIGLSITLFYYRPFRQIWKWYLLNTILPLANIIFYDPIVYRWSLGIIDPEWTYAIGWMTRGWLIVSGLVSIVLMFWRYRRITVPWLKKQVKYILLGVLALTLFYFYLGFLGPLQVTDIRTYYVLYSDFTNYNPPLTVTEWYISIIFTGLLSLISIVFIWRYTEVEKKLGKPDLQLERKLNTANMGTKVFTHAIKNQLLMLQLLVNKTRGLAANPGVPASSAEIAEHMEKMSVIVGETLQRLDQLYNSFKTTYLQLKPLQAHVMLKKTLEKLQIPEHINFISVKSPENPMILADEVHLIEALANIIINAFEAIGKEREGQVTVRMYTEANWLIVTIEDNGSGIKAEHLDVIFDPFYTNKNTNKNWGVGLSYVKQIVHGHFGHIHVKSTPGIGSIFQVLIPIYLHMER
jgi:signal transduction histidine kinase